MIARTSDLDWKIFSSRDVRLLNIDVSDHQVQQVQHPWHERGGRGGGKWRTPGHHQLNAQ